MALTLAEIRKQLLSQESKGNQVLDNAIFPFWNMKENETSEIRFLEDSDSSNPFFWRERQMINIPFNGVLGVDETKKVTVKVPCAEMWKDSHGLRCPIHDEIRPWFKDSNMESLARTYWKKKSYLFQGFAVKSTLHEDAVPENPIRRFMINSSLFNTIKAALMDPDFTEIPTHVEKGTDFKITKTKKGDYADYSTSSWARRERSLSDDEREAIVTHGLYDLNDFMPKQPSTEELAIIFAMFEDSVNGEMYDPDKYAKFYKPSGIDLDKNQDTKPAQSESTKAKATTRKVEKSKVQDPEPDDQDSENTVAADEVVQQPTSSAQDILAALRNRTKPQ